MGEKSFSSIKLKKIPKKWASFKLELNKKIITTLHKSGTFLFSIENNGSMSMIDSELHRCTGLRIKSNDFFITNSLISDNRIGIYIEGTSPRLTNNKIIYNSIGIENECISSANISHNDISFNQEGIVIGLSSSPMWHYMDMVALPICSGSSPSPNISFNTISNNSYGIRIYYDSNATIHENNIFNNYCDIDYTNRSSWKRIDETGYEYEKRENILTHIWFIIALSPLVIVNVSGCIILVKNRKMFKTMDIDKMRSLRKYFKKYYVISGSFVGVSVFLTILPHAEEHLLRLLIYLNPNAIMYVLCFLVLLIWYLLVLLGFSTYDYKIWQLQLETLFEKIKSLEKNSMK
ncbi:MAG: NosD domain-containing protein [Candidatus Thermoplasmatota archaeon]